MANNLIRNLISQIQRRLLNTSATITPNSPLPTSPFTLSSSYTVQFPVKSCGLPLASAISTSLNFQLDEKNSRRHQSVLEVLKSYNFSNAQIAKVIVKQPAILKCKVENNIQPKFEYLKENGFAGELLPKLIVANPAIIERALDSIIKPSFDFLRSVISCRDKFFAAIKRFSWLLSNNLKIAMQPNIDFLIEEGIPHDRIEYFILLQPRTIMQRHDSMVYAVNTVKNIGLEPASRMFIHALRVKLSMTEVNWKKKIELMKSMGWSEGEVLLAFKKEPYCLNCSEEKFKNLMDFYLNTMKLELQTIIACPKLLRYAIDTRLRPRYNVLKVLESKELIGRGKKIKRLLTMPEMHFQKNFVLKYADVVPGLLEMYPATRKTSSDGYLKAKKEKEASYKINPTFQSNLQKYLIDREVLPREPMCPNIVKILSLRSSRILFSYN